ncbi:hypothetical protein MKX03_020905 [Papaver bracteatum]|nr:hypothetical protein MKX03_020905 [Papaver bracteatum]
MTNAKHMDTAKFFATQNVISPVKQNKKQMTKATTSPMQSTDVGLVALLGIFMLALYHYGKKSFASP